MQKAKKLLSLVLVVALLLSMPGVALAVEGVDIVPASGRVEVSSEADLRAAVTGAPQDGTQRIIALRNDIVMEDTLHIFTPRESNIVLTSVGERRTIFQENEGRRHFTTHMHENTRLTLENVVLSGERTPGTITHDSGGIDLNGGTLTVRAGAVIRNCRWFSGAAVSVSSGAHFTMEAGELIDNSAGIFGGAIRLTGSSQTGGAFFTMNGGVIRGNSSVSNGGAISMSGNSSRLTINNGEISHNTTERAGGAIAVGFGDDIEVVINNGVIRNNTAQMDGGGIDIEASKLTINGGFLTGNRAIGTEDSRVDGNGGAINTTNRQRFTDASSTLNPTDFDNITIAEGVVFSHNFAGRGAFVPPVNREITNINTTSATIHNHPLNNNDISFRGPGDGVVHDPGPCPGVELPPPGGEHQARYMFGDAQGRFAPRANINRAEVAAILVRTMIPEFQANTLPAGMESFNAFSDVNADNWFYYYVAWAYHADLVTGDRGRFTPRDPITREQLAAMLARTLEGGYRETAGNMPFSDLENISSWAGHFVYTAFSEGWMMGDAPGGGRFRPRANISRAEVATAVNRILNRVDSAETLDAIPSVDRGNARTFPDVAENAWYFASVLGAANDHYLERDSDGNIISMRIPAQQ